MKFLYTLSLLAIVFSSASAQKQANQWYFGLNAGLNFNSGTPVPILTSAMSTYEGSASIADRTTGKLLFYTDGVSVWDTTNTVMPNGYGLGGDNSTCQSAVIIPKPGSNTLYYVFTLAAQAAGGLSVNVVDMSLNGGLGDVSSPKDSLLMTPATEKFGTYFNCNGDSVWVVVHEMYTNAFYAYLITSSGISAPVISNSGLAIANISGSNSEAIGYMRISNDGKKLGLDCEYALNIMQLSDFNSATGVVSNSIADTALPGSGPYGLCFSPDNSKLYVTYNGYTSSNVYQYNMLAGSDSAVIASRTSIAAKGGGAIQQGPDGKLYLVGYSFDSLNVIANPNALGAACNFIFDAVYLDGGAAFLGLPDIIPNYHVGGTLQPPSTTICSGSSVLLVASGGTNYSWSPSTALNNTTGDSVIATPTADVTYTVTSSSGVGCSFTDTTTITVFAAPNIPTITVKGDTLISSANTNNQWYLNDTLITGATDSIYITNGVKGTYTVAVTNPANGCSSVSQPTTGIEQVIHDKVGLSVYPNPFNNTISVKIIASSSNIDNWDLRVNDILGRTVYTGQLLNVNTFDLSFLPNGMYFMNMVSKTENVVVPIVKQ